MSEKINGGYTVQIGSFALTKIGEYSPSWINVYDDEYTFTDYQGNEVKSLLGRRFSLKITTGRLSCAEFNSLVTALKNETIAVVCPDFGGDCYCDSIPGELKQANYNGVRYTATFTLTAKEITPAGGGL